MEPEPSIYEVAGAEVVTTSALQGKIAGSGWYQEPEGMDKLIIGDRTSLSEQVKASRMADGWRRSPPKLTA